MNHFMCILFARLRTILFFLSLSTVSFAREQALFTSSVTYCEPPESLLVQQFDVAYFAKNESVFFNISVASVQPNVNVSANLLLNVYGIHAVNVTLDLCTIFSGALCPLPEYNFTGSDSLSLPKSLGVQDKIPGIAFKIPDLEGVAQLVLTEVHTGVVKACVQATLSNGWSTHQTSVEWATGGIALATALLSVWHSFNPAAILPFRLIDLLFLYQTIATSSFLSINYPSAYRAFTLNFAWAVGLFSTSPSSSLQPSIDRMRYLTGGRLANATSASAVSLVNRKLSPYNLVSEAGLSPSPHRRQVNIIDWDNIANVFSSAAPAIRSLDFPSATQGGVQTATSSSSNILQAGLPIYVNSIHIGTANAFMTLFLCSLVLIACMLLFFVAGFAFNWISSRLKRRDTNRRGEMIAAYVPLVRAWVLRLSLVLFFPISVLAFYQWTLKDSWLSIFLSVIAFLALSFSISYPIFAVFKATRSYYVDSLYTDAERLASRGPLYGQYRASRFYFFLPMLVILFLKAIIIAFAKASGEAQIIIMVILEGVVLILYAVLRPHKTKGSNLFSIFSAVMRLVCTSLMIAFVESLNVPPIPRVIIGLVIALSFSVLLVITYITLVMHSGIQWKRDDPQTSQNPGSSNISVLEKGEKDHPPSSNSSKVILRPSNPTPESSDQHAPHLLQPLPLSPTETVLTTTSRRTSGTGTMTVGSLLPRRWSFTPLSSPTNSSHIHEPSSQASHSSYRI